MLPNTIIAGAPKSGSSSLFWWLTAHPDVCGSRTKETYFFDDTIRPRFNANANFHEHDISDYEAYFSHCSGEKIRVEATPTYMYQKTALEQFQRFEERPKVLFILREPSVRVHSHFRFNKYRLGNISRDMTYEAYLEKNRNSDLDPVKRGHYIQYLKPWVDSYGADQIMVLQLEAVFKNKVAELQKVAEFLGIDPKFYETFDFMKRNETRKMRSTALHRLGLKIQPLVPHSIQEKLLVPLYLKLNSTAMPEVSAHDRAMIEEMKAQYIASNRQLSELFPTLNLELWQ